MFKNRTNIYNLVYLSLGIFAIFFLSRYWLPQGVAVGGHDSGLPFDAKEFLMSRIFAWNPNIGFGVDQSYLFGSLTLHFVDYISSLVAGTPYSGNWFNLFFWTFGIFISSFYFARNLNKYFGKYFSYLFPPLILINFYIAQSFFMLERAKYSILIGIFLFLTIFIKLHEKKISVLKASILASLVFFIFNGGSLLALPLFGSLFSIIVSITIYYLINSFTKKDFIKLKHFLSFLLLTLLFWVMLNSYQIFPYLQNILSRSYLVDLATSSTIKSLDWVDYISRNTSFLNLFRLEGVPSWFSEQYLPSPEHPYASQYLEGGLYVLISFIFPTVALSSLVIYKKYRQRKILLLFALITFISMFFSSGTHTPFGSFFGFLYENFPGFFIFRTPYYKFVGAFFIGFLVLFAAAASKFTLWVEKTVGKRGAGFIICLLLILGWFFYHGTSLTPENVFTWKIGYSTKFKIPGYVDEFNKWNKTNNQEGEKILLYPPINKGDSGDGYKWGYWSLSPLVYTLSSVPGLIDEPSLTGEEKGWVQKVYQSIFTGNQEEFGKITSKLGIRYLLLRTDTDPVITPQNQDTLLTKITSLKEIETFGKWKVYKIKNETKPEIETYNKLTLVQIDSKYLSRELAIDDLVVSQDVNSENALSGIISKKVETYGCQSCYLERVIDYAGLPAVRVFPNSPLYFLKERKERQLIEKAEDDTGRILTYLVHAQRRTSELRSMIALGVEDRYIISGVTTTNKYLEEAVRILGNHPELSVSYSVAGRTLDIVRPLLEDLNRLVLSNDFGRKPRFVRELVNYETELFNNIANFYSPILKEYSYLRNNKVYYLPLEDDVLVDSSSLPKNKNGDNQLPNRVFYTSGREEITLVLESQESRWIRIKLPENLKEAGILTLQFDQENLFEEQRKSKEFFPSGYRGCILGKIVNYDNKKSYEVNVSTNNKAQQLNLFFGTLDRDNGLKLTKSVDIYPIEVSVPFRYIFQPESKDIDLAIFLCSQDRDFPVVSAIEVYELFSPNLYAVNELPLGSTTDVDLTFRKVNPTKYLIKIDSDFHEPFLLAFNQRYSNIWKLYDAGSSGITGLFPKLKNLFSEGDYKHFQANAYSNAWVIKPFTEELVLEYKPQALFYIGSLVSAISLITLLFVLLIKRL